VEKKTLSGILCSLELWPLMMSD